MNSTSRPPSWTAHAENGRDSGRLQGVENVLAIAVFLGCAAAYMIFAGLVSSGSRDTRVTTSAVMTTQAIVDDLQQLNYQTLAQPDDGKRRRYYDTYGKPVQPSKKMDQAFVVNWISREVSDKVPPRLNVTVTIVPTGDKDRTGNSRRVHFVKTKTP